MMWVMARCVVGSVAITEAHIEDSILLFNKGSVFGLRAAGQIIRSIVAKCMCAETTSAGTDLRFLVSNKLNNKKVK